MISYTVFAGVNGAGKSTLYRTYEELHKEIRVNCDEILREFGGDWKNKEDQFKSGKIAVQRIEDCFQNKASFNQETTLASKNAIRNALRARELGYYTEMHFVYVDSIEIVLDRIENRVKYGGHGIPEETVRKRYVSSINNLRQAIDAFDTVYIYDNTNNIIDVATYYHRELIWSLDNLPNWYKTFLDTDY